MNIEIKEERFFFSSKKELIRNNESVAKILSFQEIFTSFFTLYFSENVITQTKAPFLFPDFQIEFLRNSFSCYFLKRPQINRLVWILVGMHLHARWGRYYVRNCEKKITTHAKKKNSCNSWSADQLTVKFFENKDLHLPFLPFLPFSLNYENLKKNS